MLFVFWPIYLRISSGHFAFMVRLGDGSFSSSSILIRILPSFEMAKLTQSLVSSLQSVFLLFLRKAKAFLSIPFPFYIVK